MGSVVSALLGYTILRVCPLHPLHIKEEIEQEEEVRTDGDVESLECDDDEEAVYT